MARCAAVEAKDELVEIALQVFGPQAVVDAARPPLEVGEHLVDPGEHHMGGYGADDVGLVSGDRDAGIAGPAIGLGGAVGGHVTADEAVELAGAVGCDPGQAQAAGGVAVADLDRADDEAACRRGCGRVRRPGDRPWSRNGSEVSSISTKPDKGLRSGSTMARRSLAASNQALR